MSVAVRGPPAPPWTAGPASERTTVGAGVGEDERAGAVGALASRPTSKQVCPNSADCWSPAMPAIGRSRSRKTRGSVRASSPQLGTSSGSASRGTPEQVAQLVGPVAALEVEQQRARGVGDVGDVPGAAGHPGDQVGVDGADGVAAGLDQRPRVRLVLGQPGQLGAGEVRVEPQPGQLARPASSWPWPRASGCRCPAVRRSCQTIARRGEPRVSRSHSSTVSRWLVMPIARQVRRSPSPGRRGRRGSPRGWPARSPRGSARPSRAAGSAGRTPGSPCAAIGALRRDHQGGDARGAGVDGEDAHARLPLRG